MKEKSKEVSTVLREREVKDHCTCLHIQNWRSHLYDRREVCLHTKNGNVRYSKGVHRWYGSCSLFLAHEAGNGDRQVVLLTSGSFPDGPVLHFWTIVLPVHRDR